jgi:hypothetical protein
MLNLIVNIITSIIYGEILTENRNTVYVYNAELCNVKPDSKYNYQYYLNILKYLKYLKIEH